MRLAAIVLLLAARTAVADPVTDFAAKWPRLSVALHATGAEAVLLQGTTACTRFDDRMTGPPIGDTTPAATSPDQTHLVVITTLELDGSSGKTLGLPAGWGTVAVGFDGPTGAIWARELTAFNNCNPNGVVFDWSDDGRRVFAGTDSGHGNRITLLDVAAHVRRMDAFSGADDAASPGLEHVAWKPWFSGYPFADQPVNGDILYIDDHEVWGSSDPKLATLVTQIAWLSDSALEFCGSTPKRPDVRFHVTIGKGTPRVTRSGRCAVPPSPRP